MATVEEVGKDAQSGSDKEEEMPELENQGKWDTHAKRKSFKLEEPKELRLDPQY